MNNKDKSWFATFIDSLQVSDSDFIWIESNSEFDLNLHVINPGDDIFAPFFFFPYVPLKTHLSQSLAWTQFRLTKETKRDKSKECNEMIGYQYGGKQPVTNNH